MTLSSTRLAFVAALILASASLALTGCATSGGAPRYAMKPAADARIIAADNVKTEVTAPVSVAIASYEKDRLASQVTAQVKSRAPAGARPARNYRLAIEVTRYEKGNAFARAMLAGLGQMHLDGTVSLYTLPAQTKVGEFSISKTFSWGGIYGAATTMETVEEEFAKAVAAAAAAEAPQ